jgi:CubicO group peptidase (beta-lactamase class C family)
MAIRDGNVFLTKTYGMADIGENRPIASTTNFRLASVTKQFTAMCVMILKEQGKLRYDETLTDIFSEFPEYGRSITIRHLLNHTSGLIGYASVIPEDATEQIKDADVLQLMMEQDSTYFPPGQEYRYSNSAYALLAMVVQRKSGETFEEFLDKHIFTPLKMDNTVAYEKGVSEVVVRAFGYRKINGKFVMKDQSLTSAGLGDGGIYTSLVDYMQWDRALYTGELVSVDTLKEAFTPGVSFKPEDGQEFGYGFGWRLRKIKGRKVMFHSGRTSGFMNFVVRIPGEHLTFLFLSNFESPEYKGRVNSALSALTGGVLNDVY